MEQARPAMGTELRLSVWAVGEEGEKEAAAAMEAVFREIERLEASMSTWRADSDIQRLNAAAGRHPVPVGADVRAALRSARMVSEWTDGKFDVTFGALGGLWRFDAQDQDDAIPDRGEVLGRLKRIGYRDLEWDDAAGTAFLRREGMIANLGGIGKGFAVDRARDMLRLGGFQDFLIQFGGDLYAAGQSAGRPWRLGIQDPRGPEDRIFATLEVSDSTFTTSGDYERYFIKDGRRYHHILDPTTGEPAGGCRSVTIVTASATLADGLSTGVFIMGPEAGMKLIAGLPDVEAVIVDAQNNVVVSPGLRRRLNLVAQPTDAP
jgi:thiamine biosynthesis lipoprotein